MVERARAFAYASFGILLVAAAYQLGVQSVTAQSAGMVEFAGITTWELDNNNTGRRSTIAITTTGDIYARQGTPIPGSGNCDPPAWSCGDQTWVYMGNVLLGSVPVETKSWGSLKGTFGEDPDR